VTKQNFASWTTNDLGIGQCDQIGPFVRVWATFETHWRLAKVELFSESLPLYFWHKLGDLMKTIFDNFCTNLATFLSQHLVMLLILHRTPAKREKKDEDLFIFKFNFHQNMEDRQAQDPPIQSSFSDKRFIAKIYKENFPRGGGHIFGIFHFGDKIWNIQRCQMFAEKSPKLVQKLTKIR